jgi:hypothetical protein
MTVPFDFAFPDRWSQRLQNSFRHLPLGILVLVVFNTRASLEGGTMLGSQAVIAEIDKAQQNRELELAGYTAIEHYTVRNSHFKESAELEAKVSYQKDVGKTYQVLWRKGQSFLQEHVINRILKEDTALSGSSERSRTLLTSANYWMQVQGMQALQGEQCYIVNIRPRMHEFSLIEGIAWVDAEKFALLRIEGRPAASPSFWTGRPLIEREYTIFGGLSFPKHSRATSKGFFAGKSELDIDYSQYVISRAPKSNLQ